VGQQFTFITPLFSDTLKTKVGDKEVKIRGGKASLKIGKSDATRQIVALPVAYRPL
jgi:hypothetical protein